MGSISFTSTLIIDSKSAKKTWVDLYGNGEVHEHFWETVNQNVKTGEIVVDRWYKKDDDKADKGAGRQTYTVKNDGTMSILYSNYFGTGVEMVHVFGRIGSESSP